MKIVSACLAGVNCKYNGGNNKNTKVLELVKQGQCILVCPEQLGGLPTPRTPSEQSGSKVIAKDGKDVTEAFKLGAEKALEIAKKHDCKEAILKARSPSCGGVTAKLFKKNGIKVITEGDL